MKNYPQVYVQNSFEAAALYCKAFGAKITFEIKNDTETAYQHCELSVNGEGVLALSEAANPFDIDIVHKTKWETMTFNAFEMGSVECEGKDTFSKMIKYLDENDISLAGAVNDFTCPQTGKNYMFFPIARV